jgi:DNA-binding transcriptional ArsR family regulator
MMKSDIDLFCRKFVGGVAVPIYFCLSQGITKLEDFFSKFTKVTGEEFINIYATVFEIADKLDGDPDILMQSIKDNLNINSPSEDHIYFSEFRKYPDEIKGRIDTFFKLYYTNYYAEVENKHEDFMRERIGDYIRQYEADGVDFISSLLGFDTNDLEASGKQVVIYPSYFYEAGVSQYETTESNNFIFGYLMEQRTNVNFVEKRTKEIIKVLADEKRYEILKLLGTKSYFSTQLSEVVGLTKATISYHVNKMISLGLVNMEIGENNRIYLSLDKKSLKKTFDYIYADLSNEQDAKNSK